MDTHGPSACSQSCKELTVGFERAGLVLKADISRFKLCLHSASASHGWSSTYRISRAAWHYGSAVKIAIVCQCFQVCTQRVIMVCRLPMWTASLYYFAHAGTNALVMSWALFLVQFWCDLDCMRPSILFSALFVTVSEDTLP